MTTRQEGIYAVLAQDVVLPTLGVEAIRRSGAFSNPTETCFVLLMWGTNNTPVKGATATNLTIYVYDEPGSYARIDAIIAYLEGMLPSLLPQQGFGQVRFNGSSGDAYDTMWDRATRNSSYTVV